MLLSTQYQVDPYPSCTAPADHLERRNASFREPSMISRMDPLDLLRISPVGIGAAPESTGRPPGLVLSIVLQIRGSAMPVIRNSTHPMIHRTTDSSLCLTHRILSLSHLPCLLERPIILLYFLLSARSFNTCQAASGKPSTSVVSFLILI